MTEPKALDAHLGAALDRVLVHGPASGYGARADHVCATTSTTQWPRQVEPNKCLPETAMLPTNGKLKKPSSESSPAIGHDPASEGRRGAPRGI
jgi:hypothetical protein